MWFFAVLESIAVAVLAQYLIYKKRSFEHLEYSVELSASEVFEGDSVFLYEKLSNTGRYPLPYIKVSSDLPEGLSFELIDESAAKKTEIKTGSIQSVFSLLPNTQIKRRWRVVCEKRGEYTLDGVLAVSQDLLGLHTSSKRLPLGADSRPFIVVLPRAVELEEHYTSSRYLCGDVISNHCPVGDPLRIAGAREYTPLDPMNKINWKQTAAHGKLMVNIEEKTEKFSFNLLLNMNTREIEARPGVCSDIPALERCISVCTSVLDKAAGYDLPVRLLMNTQAGEGLMERVSDEGDGSKLSISREFRGKTDILDAMRILAGVKPEISLPAEKMFDHIINNPEAYPAGSNFIVVSSYLDQRMLYFRELMKKADRQVIFYITTSRVSVSEMSEDVEIYYKSY